MTSYSNITQWRNWGVACAALATPKNFQVLQKYHFATPKIFKFILPPPAIYFGINNTAVLDY